MHKFYSSLPGRISLAAIIIFLFSQITMAQDAVQGVVRVKVSETLAARLEQAGTARSATGELTTGVASLDNLNRQFRARQMTRVFPDAGKFEARHRKHGLHLWYEVRVDKGIPLAQAVQSYQTDQHILRAEPVYQKKIVGSETPGFGKRVLAKVSSAADPLPDLPNDPLLPSQWHYHNTGQTGGEPGADISLPDAWKMETGSPSVIVAITDGGVQTDHPDLIANMWRNPGEVPDNGLDDDNNGYVDDIHGYSFVENSGRITAHDHGTHVAGTLAATSNNARGVAGIAGGSGNGDGVRLMSCAVFGYDSVPDGFPEAYVYAADNGAIISQSSWGYTLPGVFEQAVLDAIDYFIDEAGKDEAGNQIGPMNGGLAFFSAGNANDEGDYYPSFYERVIAVAATTHSDVRAYYSNYGTWVDISAPGGETDVVAEQGIISTLPGGEYGALMGTSMACPHVSGVAALIVSKYGKPGLSPDAVRSRLLMSVDDIYTRNPDYIGKLGSGRLNASIALRESDTSGPDAINDLSVSDVGNGTITLTWTAPQDAADFVSEYDLRYSTSPITIDNFDDATRVEGLPAPSPPGTTEEFTVTRLPGGKTVYFAIRSYDFAGNSSPLSNVVSETTILAPVITITPGSITQGLPTAGKATRNLVIRNEGHGPLIFSIESNNDADGFAIVSPTEGELAPEASQTVVVTISAAGKRAGTYTQNITINSNDPVSSSITVKLILNVRDNGAPIASFSPASIDFKTVQLGRTLFRDVAVRNAGSETLIISEITSSDAAFVCTTQTPLHIPSFSEVKVRVGYSPRVSGPVEGSIALTANDPARQSLTVHLKGEGMLQAPVVVSPAFLDEILESGSRVTRTLTLRNNGPEPRDYRLEAKNFRSTHSSSTSAESSAARARVDDPLESRLIQIREHQKKFEARNPGNRLARPVAASSSRRQNATGREALSSDAVRRYYTGFEEFTTGSIGDQHGWGSTEGWSISSLSPATGSRHLRSISEVTGTGEKYCVSPYLFDFDEYYLPQFTTATVRLNLDAAQSNTWEVVPQDPWSYVATRVRFNSDGTIDALVINNDYSSTWKRVPAEIPSGYFDLAIEYNNAGSDTSGLPTYYLFINNKHVFSGTGLGSAINQIAFVSAMETTGPIFDADELSIAGEEFIPHFIRPSRTAGTLQPGESTNINVQLDASIMKYGTYEAEIVIHLDDIDSLVVPVTIKIPGEPRLTRDTYSVEMLLEKNEEGVLEMFFRNDGGEPVRFDFQHDIPGLTIKPASGILDVRDSRIVDLRFNGPPGIYSDHILLNTSISTVPDTIPVQITKFDSGAIFRAPDSLVATVVAGEVISKLIRISNDGINTVSFVADVSEGLQEVVNLPHAESTLSSTPLETQVTIDATNLSPGVARGWIRFRTNDPNAETVFTYIRLTVLPAGTPPVVREVWRNVRGREVSAIPLDIAPSFTEPLLGLQGPSDSGDNYGARIRAFVIPPVTGSYTFWISSNDYSELWLSTDSTSGHATRIAWVDGATEPDQWTKFRSQRSGTIVLKANEKYYIEVLHKEGVGSDHLSVGWTMPGGTFEAPVPATRLRPFGEMPECIAEGFITRELWFNVRGAQVPDIPLSRAPDKSEDLAWFETSPGGGINYGSRIRGYICAPQTGEYRFWISSNDQSELWLSSDSDPANRQRIAFTTRASDFRNWQQFSTQRSASIRLVQGKTYYIEALHKQGVGTDHLSVGWQLPDGTLERPIGGSRLSPFRASLADESTPAGAPNQLDVRIFPNPVINDDLHVAVAARGKIRTTLPGEGVVRIIDVTGNLVHEQRLLCAGDCDATIEVRNRLVPGLYFLQITAGEVRYMERVIVR